MEILTTNCWWSTRSNGPGIHLPWRNSTFPGREFSGLFPARMILPTELRTRFGADIKAFASRNSVKKLKRVGEARKSRTLQTNKSPSDQDNGLEDGASSGDDFIHNNREMSSVDNMDTKNSINIPSRSAVLQACTVTSGLIAALGLVIRQVSHIASMEGLPIHDCSTEVSCINFHAHLYCKLVVEHLISSLFD
ncbi:hypothetical protein HHK36_007512 [Tetracentron sinense]|uniref:Uncharacterized protein n=1 Tax=Tetracentron sinense TaxID=13715 RepID=A0A835DLB9_TETSI|nr:hypothetical protein HHK36_007512 [Tetracentron sinense]